MRLTRLSTHHVRNLASATLRTDARFVVLHGPNAQGKTNTLEAIWTLCTLKALRTHRLRDLVRFQEDGCLIGGDVLGAQGQRSLKLGVAKGRRSVWLDNEPVRELRDYFEAVRAIACVPAHGRIVTDEPAQRRGWLDRAAFTLQPTHLLVVRQYQRALSQKAMALRQGTTTDVLHVLNLQLARLGAGLAQHRAEALDRLAPHIGRLHGVLTGGTSDITVRLQTDAAGEDLASREAAFAEKLAARQEEERRRRRCVVGPQSDDVVLLLDGQPARHFGSQGQVRSLVLSLKLAELVAAREEGLSPLFLLDDLSGELDAARTARLLALLTELGAQVWVSTTDPALVGADSTDTAEIGVAAGKLAVLRGPAQVDQDSERG